jgi:hypothetical protein
VKTKIPNPLDYLRAWHNAYVEDALDQDQPRYWQLYWGGIILACAIFLVYMYWFNDLVDLPARAHVSFNVLRICILIPFTPLRRLHLLGLMLFFWVSRISF